MNKLKWKFLEVKGRRIVSAHGSLKWKIGQWEHVDGDIRACSNGLHCSDGILEALGYVKGGILARVEVKGDHHDMDDKYAYSDMRIVEAYKWTKKDSLALSIFAAELCLKEFEKLYPNEPAPRNAIEAANKVLKGDTKATRSARSAAAAAAAESAAWSAARSAARSAESAAESAAWSARSAESAARSAESAARSAARSAESAAWSAAWSAESAAWSAAWSAARKRTLNKIEKWLVDHTKEMEKL